MHGIGYNPLSRPDGRLLQLPATHFPDSQGTRRALNLMQNLKIIFFTAMALLAGGSLSKAASPPFTQCPAVGVDTGCAILIEIKPDNTTAITLDPSQIPFFPVGRAGSTPTPTNGALIGVQNNSSNALVALRIGTGNTGPAAFAFVGAGLCAARPRPAGCLFGPTGYEGPGVSFTDINVNRTAGIVRFAGGIAPGGSAYFTLAGGNLTAESCPAPALPRLPSENPVRRPIARAISGL